MTPVISVIMPVYNTERFVAETTETVLAQTFHDFEFIILDAPPVFFAETLSKRKLSTG